MAGIPQTMLDSRGDGNLDCEVPAEKEPQEPRRDEKNCVGFLVDLIYLFASIENRASACFCQLYIRWMLLFSCIILLCEKLAECVTNQTSWNYM